MQEEISYSQPTKEITYTSTMDRVRKFILERAETSAGSLASWSRAIGKNHAYLHQFVHKGSPHELPERVRRSLAQAMRVPESRLMADPDVRSEDIAASLPAPAPTKKVKLKGYVGAGSEAHFYALADEDYEEVEAPLGATNRTVAVEIRGRSFGPLMDTWLVFYDDIRSPITDDLIGKVCVIGLSDDRILIKKIARRNGGFILLSNSTEEPPIENARIEWAARVTDMRPK